MKGKALRNNDPATLTDDELDIVIGYIQQEIEVIGSEISQAQTMIANLRARRTEARDLIRAARIERRSRP